MIIDINNANYRAYMQLPGMSPVHARKIAGSGPYADVSDIYKIEGLTAEALGNIKKYEKNFAVKAKNPASYYTSFPIDKKKACRELPDNNDHHADIIIAAARVLDDNDLKWVSISNYSSLRINLDWWTLDDGENSPLTLSGCLDCGESKRIAPLTSDKRGGEEVKLGETGTLKLKDCSGTIVDFQEWKPSDIRENGVVIFN